jgi:hypothetical protein
MDLEENKKLMKDYKNNIIEKDEFVSIIIESMYFFQEEQEENPITDGDWTFKKENVEHVIMFLNKKHNQNINPKSKEFWFGGFVDDQEIMSAFDIDDYDLFEAFANIIIDDDIYVCC